MSQIKIKNFKKVAALLGLGVLVVIKLTGVLGAQSVTKGYGSDQTLERGMIVGVDTKNSSKVVPINSSRGSDILGVVVNPSDSPISISSDNEHIYVASIGYYEVLVSDQNGKIRNGDYIVVSAASGIGMKASSQEATILGHATSDFDGKSNVISTAILTGAKNNKEIHIGRIPVEIGVAKNPLANLVAGAPALLNKAGIAIAGKSVSPLRLYLSAIVFIIGTVTAGSILYAGIRSSIIAIGRNPLGKQSIVRSTLGVSIMGLIVFIISVIGVYLILKL